MGLARPYACVTSDHSFQYLNAVAVRSGDAGESTHIGGDDAAAALVLYRGGRSRA
jgi:hypothetical protein